MPLLTFPWPQILSADGSTYPGAKLFFYETGTSTLATTYSDAGLTTPHTNPVIADATGVFPPIYLANKRYKAVLKTAGDVTLFSADPAHEPATPSVATIAAMTAIDAPTNGMTVHVSDLDRGGYFVFDTTSTSAADNGVTFKADDATSGSWVRQYSGPLNVKWFGAVGDGIANDAPALQLAINAAVALGRPVSFVSDATYAISAALSVDGDLIIDGCGAVIAPAASTNGIVVDAGTSDVTSLAADAQIHAETITVAAAGTISSGDLIKLVSTANWYINPDAESLFKGELARVKSVSGTTVTLEDALFDNYDVSAETVAITKLNRCRFICRDLSVVYGTPTTAVGIQVTGAVDSVLENVTVDGAQTQGISIRNCYDLAIRNCRLYRCNSSTLGYGVQINESLKVSIANSSFIQNRRGVDLSGSFPTRLCVVSGNVFDGSGVDSTGAALANNSGNSACGDHETSEYNSYLNNRIRNCRFGVLLRGKDSVVSGNYFEGDIRIACVIVNKGYNVSIRNNSYAAGLRPGRTLDVVAADDDEQKCPWFVQIFEPVNLTGGYFDIAENVTRDLKNAFLSLNFPTAAQTINNIYCCNNIAEINGSTTTSAVYFLEIASGGENVTVENSIILDNKVREGIASLTMYHPGVLIDYEETCDVDNYALPSSVLTETTGVSEANISKTQVLLNLSVRDGIVSIVGAVQFDILNATSVVKLQNLPSKSLNAGTFGPSYAWPFVASVTTSGIGTAGMVAMPSGVTGSVPTSAWLSYDQTAYNTGWPVGSGYLVPVSISYRTVRRLE